jgi:ferredoxin-NADP reductase
VSELVEQDTELEVVDIVCEADGVVSVALRMSSGDLLPEWSPGAHVDLVLPSGVERQYSLCSDPADRSTWRVAILREPQSRGGSVYIHDRLAVGDRLRVRGPRNHFPLLNAEEYRLIAGGIGITPLLPMIDELRSRGAAWRLLYGGRRRESMAFLGRLAGDSRVEVCPEDECGLLDLDSFLAGVGASTHVYVCGPELLIEAVEVRAAGWPPDTLRVERFRPRSGALDGVDEPFTVVLERSGVTVQVAAGQTIVEAIERAGIGVPTSCREGTCGTCESEVLQGIPDHRDSVLTDTERKSNKVMMICCSRALTDTLVLDR